jgi:hypothetical protein
MIFGSIQISLFLRTDVARLGISDLDLTVVALLGWRLGSASTCSASAWFGVGHTEQQEITC